MTITKLLTFIFALLSYLVVEAQQVIPLYENIPCANEHKYEVEDKGEKLGRFITKVHSPEVEVFLPEDPNGTAVLLCPGGGYSILAYDWEGISFAKWFNKLGITAVVLKYRLPQWENEECRSSVALSDAQRAMEIINEHASDWRVDPSRVGVMGFSAGGHLASTLSTHPVSVAAKPDFSILVYPVISMDSSFAHMGSRTFLLGDNPSEQQLRNFSNELRISEDTPPTLLVHSSDDLAVPVENSIRYYEQLVKHNVPASMLIYETGGHGFAMAEDQEGAVSHWLEDVQKWMKQRGLLSD